MSEETDPQRQSLDETMVARLQVDQVGSATHEKEMADALQAIAGVREVTFAKGALHVTYDPLETSEKEIEQAIRASGNTVSDAATDTEVPHPPDRPPAQ